MTPTPAPTPTTPVSSHPATQPPAAQRTHRRTRAEGQWALGYREPLNGSEQTKKDDDALNVRARILDIYAHHGFASIDPADLRSRFRWWGLYTQRRQGIDGGRTAALEPHELEDEFFMLRVRVDGGQLTTEQLRTIADISTTYARDSADITDRQNIQLHWVRIEDVPAIWERLESVGLSTQEACGDAPRVIIASPVAGIAADEVIDPTWAVNEISERYIGDRQFSNLPRKFKTALTGHPTLDVAPEINDVAFVPSVHPDNGPGFDVWVGGGLSTNPMLAQSLGVWVPLADVPDVWRGVVSIFRDYGYRRLRGRARLKFLVADWGVAAFREVLEQEYLQHALDEGDPPPRPQGNGDHVGIHRQVDGRSYVGVSPTAGRVPGTTLAKLADIAEAHGSTRLRTTPYQKLVILDVDEHRVDSLVRAVEDLGLSTRPSQWRRSTMACTGIEFCKLAIVETKDRAAQLVAELEDRIPELDTPITVHLNGCPNSCARIQVADIGLKGQLVLDDDGNQVGGFQVHLGGGLGLEPGFGRKLRGHKVAADGLTDYVERLV
ncbi:MAG: nitrite/sulfite reductase, partial [Nocardioidaceae bacterium]